MKPENIKVLKLDNVLLFTAKNSAKTVHLKDDKLLFFAELDC